MASFIMLPDGTSGGITWKNNTGGTAAATDVDNDNDDTQYITEDTNGHRMTLTMANPGVATEDISSITSVQLKFKARYTAGAGTTDLFTDLQGTGITHDTEHHKMHTEWGKIEQTTADLINKARNAGGKIIPGGSTSLRILETAANSSGVLQSFAGETDIFITPGYIFKIADKMITNFHLPRSTLFMLVAAFSGLNRIKSAYTHAINQQYRFFSYGDACLLEKGKMNE